MNSYNLSITLENIKTIIRMILDIGIMWMLLYYAIKIVRNNSRTIQLFKGIILILMVDWISKILGLTTVSWLAGMFVNWGFLAVIIVFQPEIRSVLEKIGKTSIFSKLSSLSGNEKENLVDAVVTASMLLSRNQTGALITLEQTQSLSDYINTGTKINSVVSAELLTSIFVTSTPLHDGAVIIQGDRIACASAYFPLTSAPVPTRYGTRHRAALGISELTDAVTIVVSEETGSISIAEAGRFIQVNRKELKEYLMRIICGRATEVNLKNKVKPVAPVIVEREESTSAGDDEYVIEPTTTRLIEDASAPAKTDTSVLSRLAIKRYSDTEEDHEEVTLTSEIAKPEEEKLKIKKEKKHFGLFKKKEKKVDKKIKAEEPVVVVEEEKETINLEESNIKLPKKRNNVPPISFEMDQSTSHLPRIEDDTPRYSTQNIRAMGNTERLSRQEIFHGSTAKNRLSQTNTQSLSGEELRRARAEAIRNGSSRNTTSMRHPIHDTQLQSLKDEAEKKRGVRITMDFSEEPPLRPATSQNTRKSSIIDDAVEIEGPRSSQLGGNRNDTE